MPVISTEENYLEEFFVLSVQGSLTITLESYSLICAARTPGHKLLKNWTVTLFPSYFKPTTITFFPSNAGSPSHTTAPFVTTFPWWDSNFDLLHTK